MELDWGYMYSLAVFIQPHEGQSLKGHAEKNIQTSSPKNGWFNVMIYHGRIRKKNTPTKTNPSLKLSQHPSPLDVSRIQEMASKCVIIHLKIGYVRGIIHLYHLS